MFITDQWKKLSLYVIGLRRLLHVSLLKAGGKTPNILWGTKGLWFSAQLDEYQQRQDWALIISCPLHFSHFVMAAGEMETPKISPAKSSFTNKAILTHIID